nr:DWNN domain-containing protein [Tanacetum cinerariifolium]
MFEFEIWEDSKTSIAEDKQLYGIDFDDFGEDLFEVPKVALLTSGNSANPLSKTQALANTVALDRSQTTGGGFVSSLAGEGYGIRDQFISKRMCVCGATDRLADELLPNKTLRETINGRIETKCNSSASRDQGRALPADKGGQNNQVAVDAALVIGITVVTLSKTCVLSKESLEVEIYDDLVHVKSDEWEEESAEETLIRRKHEKGNGIEETRSSPPPTPIKSSRTYISPLYMDKETL